MQMPEADTENTIVLHTIVSGCVSVCAIVMGAKSSVLMWVCVCVSARVWG